MALENDNLSRIFRMLLLVGLGQLVIFVEAAPVGLSSQALPSPDLLLCVVCYWALRRPDSTPVALVFLLGISRDLLTDTPLGAGTLSLVFAAEAMKNYRNWLMNRSAAFEYLAIGLAAAGSLMLQWFLVVLTFGQPPYLAQLAIAAFFTTAVYPVLALSFRWLLRVGWRKDERRGFQQRNAGRFAE